MDPQKYLTKCVKRKAGHKGEPATANKKKQCITYLNDESHPVPSPITRFVANQISLNLQCITNYAPLDRCSSLVTCEIQSTEEVSGPGGQVPEIPARIS
jgi:hypothetical protein